VLPRELLHLPVALVGGGHEVVGCGSRPGRRRPSSPGAVICA
jgi:hypothetical protein